MPMCAALLKVIHCSLHNNECGTQSDILFENISFLFHMKNP